MTTYVPLKKCLVNRNLTFPLYRKHLLSFSYRQQSTITTIDNLLNNEYVPPSTANYIDVYSPTTDNIIARVASSNATDVENAVKYAQAAFPEWSHRTLKNRASVLLQTHALLLKQANDIASLVVQENGKNQVEALASVMKGLETLEYAAALANSDAAMGKKLLVSRGISCQELREPLGIVASVVPFNFPAMVPMWTVPIALMMGNCIILKPSEKVPMTMQKIASAFMEAGLPPGVFQLVHGAVEPVEAICDHPKISAVTFVGSSKVAQLVARRCRAQDKRVLALGGAKNHLVALPDADFDAAAADIVASFAGCAGQRCMAASALILVGNCDKLLEHIVSRAGKIVAGTGPGQMGPLIDSQAKSRVLEYIGHTEKNCPGAKVLLDGRSWVDKQPTGAYVGPTILLHENVNDKAMKDEIFGPVLSVIKVATLDEALEIERANDYGNAAAIYTTNGAVAEYCATQFRASMIGVNIGIPVPREPFSFGGMYGTKSKYGDMDITGDGGVEFFTQRRKITSKWIYTATSYNTTDAANFAGQM